MRAIVVRELALAARSPAFLAAVVVHAAAAAAFVLVWGPNGVPALPGNNVFEQLGTVQWALLVFLLPWTAARLTTDRGDGLVRLSALAAVPASRVAAAKLLAAWATQLVVVFAALPIVILAQRMSAVPLWLVARDLAPLVVLAAFVCAVTAWWMSTRNGRIASWLGATATTVIAVTFVPAECGGTEMTVAMAVVAVTAASAVAATAGARWRYLLERQA